MPDRIEHRLSPIDRAISRRRVLAGMAGLAGLGAVPGVLAACGSSPTPTPSVAASVAPSASVSPSPTAPPSATPTAGGTISLGSYYSDSGPKAAMQAAADGFTKATEIDVTISTVDQAKFVGSIDAYLAGSPAEVVTWFAGFQAQRFEAKGLVADISDVWGQVGTNFSAASKAASTGADGKQYLVPISTHPWVLIYRKSLWGVNAYEVPTTAAALTSLMDKMLKDGLAPLAFGNKDGRSAMAVFDILDLRLNGYDFHVGLLAGRQKWTDAKVKAVFQKWAGWLGKHYFQDGSAGRTWQDAAGAVFAKKAGMCLIGTFAADQAPDQATRDDLDMFSMPALGSQFDAELAIDAPTDGFMLSKGAKDSLAAKAFLEYLATGAAQVGFLASDRDAVATAQDADTTKYSAWQKRAMTVVGAPQKVAGFLDRDTRPDFVGQSGMAGFLADFVAAPTQDIDAFLRGIQSAWDALPALP